MKVRQRFETDSVAEVEGIWIDIGDGAEIRVARAGNPKYSEVTKKLQRPYKNMLLQGRDLPKSVAESILVKGIAEAILLDWKGFENEDGSPLPYSKEKAIELLTDLRDFRDNVIFLASEAETFRKHALEDAAKN